MRAQIMRKSVFNGTRAALAALAIGACGTALAHHSFSMFDMKTTKTLTGTVKQFEWTNPHTWLWVMVPNEKGELEQWGIEGMSPNFLGRRGWTRTTLQPGMTVTVMYRPMKDGKNGGMFQTAKLANGTLLTMMGAEPTGQQ